jgi:hypothetical protein
MRGEGVVIEVDEKDLGYAPRLGMSLEEEPILRNMLFLGTYMVIGALFLIGSFAAGVISLVRNEIPITNHRRK